MLLFIFSVATENSLNTVDVHSLLVIHMTVFYSYYNNLNMDRFRTHLPYVAFQLTCEANM